MDKEEIRKIRLGPRCWFPLAPTGPTKITLHINGQVLTEDQFDELVKKITRQLKEGK